MKREQNVVSDSDWPVVDVARLSNAYAHNASDEGHGYSAPDRCDGDLNGRAAESDRCANDRSDGVAHSYITRNSSDTDRNADNRHPDIDTANRHPHVNNPPARGFHQR